MKKSLTALALIIGLMLSSSTGQAKNSYKYESLPESEFQRITNNNLNMEKPYIFKDFSYENQPKNRPTAKLPTNNPKPESKGSKAVWKYDREVSWYGPGFYGKKTACGQKYTKTILGVAHRSLPCGTLVTFKYKNKSITVPVIDRGPYVAGRTWDLSGGLCVYLDHCFTGPLYYFIHKK